MQNVSNQATIINYAQPLTNGSKAAELRPVNEAFVEAFKNLNFVEVEKYLDLGADAYSKIPINEDLFIKAVSSFFSHMTDDSGNSIIEIIPDQEVKNFLPLQLPCVLLAFFFKQDDVLEKLLDKGVSFHSFEDMLSHIEMNSKAKNEILNLQEDTDLLSLLYCTISEEPKLFDQLIRLGFFEEYPDIVMDYAMRENKFDILDQLIQKGFFDNITSIEDSDKTDWIHDAIQYDKLEVLEYLDKFIPDDFFSYPSAIHDALLTGDVKLVKYLLSKGADFQTPCPWSGQTLLEVATERGFTEIADYLKQQRI